MELGDYEVLKFIFGFMNPTAILSDWIENTEAEIFENCKVVRY